MKINFVFIADDDKELMKLGVLLGRHFGDSIDIDQLCWDSIEGMGSIEIPSITQDFMEALITYYEYEDIIVRFCADELLVGIMEAM